MSEGPEVRRVARQLHDKLAGETILEVEAHHKTLRALLQSTPDKLIGRRIERVYTIGKHILFELDDGAHLHNHLLMFGSWRIYGNRAKVPPDPRTMEIIRTTKHRAVLRGGSVFERLEAGEIENHKSLSKLGPDVLGETFDTDRALANLRRQPDMEIGVALLQQEILAGIGNYLKSEVLFLARLDPTARIRELTDAQLRELLRISHEVSLFALENGSFTITDEIRTRLDETGMSPFTVGRKHYVFRRTNKPCWVCGTPIRQFRQGEGRGRITYACPKCQGLTASIPIIKPSER